MAIARKWDIITLYFNDKFINEYYNDFLKLIKVDPTLRKCREETRGKKTKSFVSAVVRDLIERYVKGAKQRLRPSETNNNNNNNNENNNGETNGNN